MASEQFSLCWDNFHKNMSSGMNSLLESEDLVDVTLAVEGKYLKAHKMVLSVCSPYFRDLFKINPCKHPIVFMKDVSYVAMSDLLQFMYQGEVQVSQENLTTFIKTAEALQIKGLTGDGNGSAECDNDQDDSKSTEIETPKLPPTTTQHKVKKVHQPAAPPATKRPRLSVPETSTPSVTKTEHPVAQISSATSSNELVQFKMEPYDQGQSTVTVPDDNPDETFNEDPLDETNADDGNEDYSMMEGGDEEPQAGTSADGAAGEGQGNIRFLNDSIRALYNNLVPVEARTAGDFQFPNQSFLTTTNTIFDYKYDFENGRQTTEENILSLKLIFDKENDIKQQITDLKTSFDELIQIIGDKIFKDVSQRVQLGTDIRTITPITSLEEMNALEENLKNPTFFNKIIEQMTYICGQSGKQNGIDCCYKLVDYLLNREFLTKCSWTGNTRNSDETKIPLKFYQNFRKMFLTLILKADKDFSEDESDKFFKRILKNSTQRVLNNKILSTHKKRPQHLTYKKKISQAPADLPQPPM